MKLKPSPKIYQNYKCDYPENTIKRIDDGFKEIGLDIGYVKKVASAKNCSIYSGRAWIKGVGFFHHGKATKAILAKASTYAELAERYSAGQLKFYIHDSNRFQYLDLIEDVIERKHLKGYQKNEKSPIFDINNICNYLIERPSTSIYTLLKRGGYLQTSVEAFSLVNNNCREIPIHLIDMIAGSNGLASGNTYEEAISQAACEIFERYAIAKILSNKKICNTIDPYLIKDKRIHDYIEMFNSMNIDILIKDFSLNNNIPVVGVLFTNSNIENEENELMKKWYHKTIHAGSDLDINEAIIRCFTEHFQWKNNEDITHLKKLHKVLSFWSKNLKKRNIKSKNIKSSLVDFEFKGDLSFLEKGKTIPLNKLISIKNNDSLEDVKSIIRICKINNWDIQILNLTNKSLKFPVVRAIIPPISTGYDMRLIQMLKLKKQEQHFNYFYGINNFYYYVHNDNWIKNNSEINKLIDNLEDFLSREPDSYELYLTGDRFFYHYVNLFYVLALSYLSIKKYEKSLEYFRLLYELDMEPVVPSNYFKVLWDLNFNKKNYSNYIKKIKEELQNSDDSLEFKFEKNPFKPVTILDSAQKKLIISVFKNINKNFI